MECICLEKETGDSLEQYFTNNPNLKSELHTIIYKHEGEELTFYSDNGVFSKDKLDFGSNLLLSTLFNYIDKDNLKVLDVGCGYGFLGVSIAKIKNAHVTMCDVNKRALHLAEKNVDVNDVSSLCKVIESNMYEHITDIYDLVITNPPIRAGKEVVYGILDGARDRLKVDGELWMVIRKDQGAKSVAKDLEREYKVDIVNKNKGFYIICASKR